MSQPVPPTETPPESSAPLVHAEEKVVNNIGEALAAAKAELAARSSNPKPRRQDGRFAQANEAETPPESQSSAHEEISSRKSGEPGEGESSSEGGETQEGGTKEDDPTEQRKAPPPKSWQALFKREKVLRERESQMEQRIRSLEQTYNQAQKALEIQKEYEEDPYSFVEKRGFDYDKWAQRRLANGQPDPQEQQLKQQQTIEDQIRNAEHKIRNEMRAQAWVDAVPVVAENPKYQDLRAYCGNDQSLTDAAATVAATHLQKTGRWLTQAEACDMLVAELNAQMERMQSLRPQPASKAPSTPSRPRPSDKHGQAHNPSPASENLSPHEEMRRLAKLIRWGD